MADKAKRVLLNTPILELVWPKLHEADTKFKAEGEYNTKGRLDPNNKLHATFMEKVTELVAEALQKAKDENPKFAKVMTSVLPFSPELDDQGDETGFFIMNFKKAAKVTSKKNGKTYEFKVMLYDANLAPLAPSIKVGGGSKARISFEPYAYFNAKDKEAGISARMEAVQVVELREYVGRDGTAFGFAVEEGGFDGSNADPEAVDQFAPQAGVKGDF